ncbi:MAG: bifunctional methylenetetrahydrofolate dehydrogenase/methenyltetrahydrofolate cyclohydrolase FolD [Hyphomicrobiaceae bacterium]
MAGARIIDGKALAERIRSEVADGVALLQRTSGVTPGLAVVLVGQDPASEIYVRNKARQTIAAGMLSFEHLLAETTSEAELLRVIAALNADSRVHGILVQLPLPGHVDSSRVIAAIDPAKDVDGFHPLNVGRAALGQDALVPCTPIGCLLLAKTVHERLDGLHAVVIGRSNIVGRPVARLLLQENCTVTVAHSRTRDIANVVRQGDLVVVAAGRAELVRGDWIKRGATVIDVGINRVAGSDGKARLVGDVAFAEVAAVAGAITPVPGGVGPMTIACLLQNTLLACRRSLGAA